MLPGETSSEVDGTANKDGSEHAGDRPIWNDHQKCGNSRREFKYAHQLRHNLCHDE